MSEPISYIKSISGSVDAEIKDESQYQEIIREVNSNFLDIENGVFNDIFQITDNNRNVSFSISNDGFVKTGKHIFENIDNIIIENVVSDKEVYISDVNGNVILYIDKDGKIYKRPNIHMENININTNLSHFIAYGQSWSVGYSGSKQGIFSNGTKYNNLMFYGGVIAYKDKGEDRYSSLVPLSEKEYSGGYYETPVSGQCEMVKQLLLYENGYESDSYQIIGTAPGEGAKTLGQLKKGTEYYNNLIEAVTNAKEIADRENKKYSVDAISWIQGSRDKSGLNQLQKDLDTDIKGITHQENDVKLITWQSYAHDISDDVYDAYVDVNSINKNIVCAFAGYSIPHINDGENNANNIHFTPVGNRVAGEYFGIVFKRVILEGLEWEPLKPEKVSIEKNIITIKYHVPVPPITINTSIVMENENYGFKIFNEDGTENRIVSVNILGIDKIVIVCENNVDENDTLSYASIEGDGDPYARDVIARGNVCDSQQIFSETGCYLPNFSVAFAKKISYFLE